jgi:hypothetical protein
MIASDNNDLKNSLPLSDYNAWAKFWFYIVGANPIPAQTRRKETYFLWKQYQNEPMPEEVFEQLIKENRFKDGMAVILGKVWRGEHAGLYLTLIDLDNLKAIDEFCSKDGVNITLEQVAQKYIVERHKDNLNKAHVLFYSEIPFVGKSNDANSVSDFDSRFRNNEIPAFEIKGLGNHGIVFCTPSIHQDGEHYEIIGVTTPTVLSEKAAHEMMQHIDTICKKNSLHYLDKKVVESGGATTTSKNISQSPMSDLYNLDLKTIAGNNRHLRNVRLSDSLILNLRNKMSLEHIKQVHRFFNQTVNIPPKSEEEWEEDWQAGLKWVAELDAQQGREELLDGCEMMELISRSPETYAAVIKKDDYNNSTIGIKQNIRAIQEIQIKRVKDKESGAIEIQHHYKYIILNAAPIPPIEIIKDPLFGHTKYRIRFEYVGPGNQVIQMEEPVGPFTKDELKEYLLTHTCWVYKAKLLDDALNHILKGYESRKGMSKTIIEIEPEGFFLLNDKIVASKLNLKEPTPSTAVQTIQTISDMQSKFFTNSRDRNRLAYYTKKFMVAPFDYVRKQKDLVHRHHWITRGDLCGAGGTGKTEYGRYGCYIWRLKTETHILPKRAIDSEARIANTLGSTTMPLTFEEPDFLSPRQSKKPTTENILSALKTTVDTLEGFRLTHNWQRIPEPYLAYFIITHNSNPIAEEGTTRRFQIDVFRPQDKKDTKKNKQKVEEYRQFIEENKENLAYLGDFVAYYVMSHHHPEVLKNDWLTTSKNLLKALFEFAGMKPEECPKWLLDGVIEDSSEGGSGFSDSDLEDQRRELLRSALGGYITDSWSKHRYEYDRIASASPEILPTNSLTTAMIVKWLLEKHKLQGFAFHEKYGVCMTTAVMDALKGYGLDSDDRIKHSDLEDLCGFKEGWIKLKKKSVRVKYANLNEFTDFIAPTAETLGPLDKHAISD